MGNLTTTESLRRDILAGVFAPGDRLIELELTERYSARRSEIREALSALKGEQLVAIGGSNCATVRAIEVDERREIAEARGVLECLMARRAAERATVAERDELHEVYCQMEVAQGRGDLDLYLDLNKHLHRRVAEISGHITARCIISTMRNSGSEETFPAQRSTARLERSLAEHQAVVAAITEGDPDAAETAMRDHMDGVISTITAA